MLSILMNFTLAGENLAQTSSSFTRAWDQLCSPPPRTKKKKKGSSIDLIQVGLVYLEEWLTNCIWCLCWLITISWLSYTFLLLPKESFSFAFAETGGHYELESGFFMKSFTATIFVASLVTLGVLLITLVISLVIMLQSCQSKSAGVIELLNINDYYSYCRVYSLHAELNNLEGYNLPRICRDLAVHYIKVGQYARDLDLTMSVIDDYFKSVRPSEDGLDVVLMDIDDIFPRNSDSFNLFHR